MLVELAKVNVAAVAWEEVGASQLCNCMQDKLDDRLFREKNNLDLGLGNVGKRKCRLLLWSVRPPWKGPAGTWINVKIFIGNSFDEYLVCGWPVKYFFGSPVKYSRDLPPLLADYLFPLLLFVPEATDQVMSSLKRLKMFFFFLIYWHLAAWCFLRFTLKQYLTFFQDKDIIDNNWLFWFLNNILLRPNEQSEIVRSFQPWAFEETFYISMIFFHLSSIMAVLRSFHGLLSSTFASFVSSTFLATWQYRET